MNSELMFGYLIHLSTHMWDDENTPPRGWYQPQRYTEKNNVDLPTWDATIRFLQERKYNMLLIDVGDAVKYESHPEISASDAWDKDFFRKKLDEIRAAGITPLPKLNFSCCHHTWLKGYRRMVSSPAYYQACSDVIKEVCELFDGPELIHFGLDEENVRNQKFRETIHIRQGDLWWHDAYFYFDEAEKYGARPWVWSDYCWEHSDEFFRKMPKSVVQSNWFYGLFSDYPAEHANTQAISTYELLDKHGFEQIPTCSCWSSAGAHNVRQTLAHGKAVLSPELIRGYMVAPWCFTRPDSEYEAYHNAHSLYCARRDYYPETL